MQVARAARRPWPQYDICGYAVEAVPDDDRHSLVAGGTDGEGAFLNVDVDGIPDDFMALGFVWFCQSLAVQCLQVISRAARRLAV